MKRLRILTLGKYIKKKIDGNSIYNFLSKKNFSLKHYNEFQKINSTRKFDIVISYGYGLILSADQIKNIAPKIINLHIGYLPFARGIYPLLWSIIFNKPIGFSIHTIDNNEIDVGRLIYRKKINYSSSYSLKDIHEKCLMQINNVFFQKFYLIIKKTRFKNISKSRHYFNKSISNKLLLALPKKWNTKVSYLKNNSKTLKKIYKKKK